MEIKPKEAKISESLGKRLKLKETWHQMEEQIFCFWIKELE